MDTSAAPRGLLPDAEEGTAGSSNSSNTGRTGTRLWDNGAVSRDGRPIWKVTNYKWEKL